MSGKVEISVNDFNLFFETMKSLAKIVESAKMTINENGFVVYGARERMARCEVCTNSVFSQDEISFAVKDLGTFVKVLQTVKEVHEDDFSDLKFTIDLPTIRFQSKKFKTKIQCCTEDIIEKWISKKVEAELKPVFEFTTTSDYIKRVNSHSYIYTDAQSLRVYLETKEEMENNTLYASIGNRGNDLNNEMTLKFGIVTFGSLGDRNLVLDLPRVNLFNTVQTNDIKVSLMDKNVLVSKVKVVGKKDSYFTMTVYNSLIKA